MIQASAAIPRISFGRGDAPARPLAREVAVALSFNGTTQAVMMATPADLTDFAYGFAASEGIAMPEEIASIDIVETPLGIDLQIWVSAQAEARLSTRRRTMAGPVGCGLCGIDSLEQALRAVKPVLSDPFSMTPTEVMAAMADLPRHQPLHDATRAIHAAAYWSGEILAAREDVGRHNALDKLIGGMVRASTHPTGAVLLTSRVSIDMVQKVAALGAPILIAASAPTDAAMRMAEGAGITLIANARAARFDLFTHPHRITQEAADVA
ncbi:MAG: formate dehydrogenase accessory sulfurtransferase FdhD [Cypionkella sp.]|nr:formate dehydrogenase accessory sulfurtransferase FdhD [Cypionkella sp.]